MLDRLVIALLLTIAGLGAWRVLTRRTSRRVARLGRHDPLLTGVADGVPVIVYFTTPDCTVCRHQQEPALQTVAAGATSELQIVRVDASLDPDAASRWGILTAPTTVVLDAERQPRHVNHGLASAETLLGQLSGVAAARPS
jgi:thiol-disulfide isomerase/thioredoxin